MAQSDTYTRWAVLASGEGGGRIASTLFSRTENPGIDDRVLVMNTNRTDIANTIERLERNTIDVQDIRADHTLEFGPLDGVGNYFPGGEQCAKVDQDRINRQIEDSGIDQSDAFLYMMTLGGGTGNGSVPYIIKSLKDDPPTPAMENIVHVALAAWPYDFEGGQRHFNAVCGLSRLLRWYDGTQNADMVILASNSHVSNDEDLNGPDEDRYESVNRNVIEAVDMMIGAGRQTHSVVDVSDLITWPSRLDAYHFTPGIAMDQPSVFELDLLFDKAADNVFVPMDPSTSKVVYAVVRAPEHLIEAGEYTEADLEMALQQWLDNKGMDEVVHQMPTLTPSTRQDDTVDVLLLFGGFDLDPLLDASRPKFDRIMDEATEHGLATDIDAPTEEFTAEQFRTIQQNLDEYLSGNRR
jgi:cell division GTPase FtsZ